MVTHTHSTCCCSIYLIILNCTLVHVHYTYACDIFSNETQTNVDIEYDRDNLESTVPSVGNDEHIQLEDSCKNAALLKCM